MTAHLLTLLVLATSAQAPAPKPVPPQPVPEVVSYVILDVSGSMAQANKLATARAEVLVKAGQLPPSPASPYVVILFESSVRATAVFDSGVEPLREWFAKVDANGGTDVAQALAHSVGEIRRFLDARHIVIYLYTDYEDSNVAGIAEQERRLDQVFGQRHARNLSQTVVLKQWAGDPKRAQGVFGVLQKSPHVDFIDAGNASFLHATFDPSATARSAVWIDDRTLGVPIRLEVTARANATPPGGWPPITVRCLTPGLAGTTTWEVRPGGPPVEVVLKVPANPSSSTTELAFEAERPAPVKLPSGLVLSSLARPRWTLSIAHPPQTIDLALKTRAVLSRPIRWEDPIARSADAAVTLSVEATATSDRSFPGPVRLSVTPDPGLRVLEGATTLDLARPGATQTTVRVAYDADRRPELGFTVRATSVPEGVKLNPTSERAATPVAPPAPVTTTIVARFTHLTPSRWVDLRDGMAEVVGRLAVEVQGPLRKDTVLTVASSPGVVDYDLDPRFVTTGTQELRVTFRIRMPARGEFQGRLDILAPDPQGGVVFGPIRPVKFACAPPPPVALALLQGDRRRPTRIVVPYSDGAGMRALPLTPVVLGASPAAAGNLAVRITYGPGLQPPADGETTAPLFRPLSLSLETGDSLPQPGLFRDQWVETSIRLTSVPSSPYIQDTTCSVAFYRPALFKAYAPWIAGGIGLLVLGVLLTAHVRTRLEPDDMTVATA